MGFWLESLCRSLRVSPKGSDVGISELGRLMDLICHSRLADISEAGCLLKIMQSLSGVLVGISLETPASVSEGV